MIDGGIQLSRLFQLSGMDYDSYPLIVYFWFKFPFHPNPPIVSPYCSSQRWNDERAALLDQQRANLHRIAQSRGFYSVSILTMQMTMESALRR